MNKQSGFIRLFLLVIVAILVLSYFNISVKQLAEKPQTKENIGYVVSIGSQVWHEVLSKPVKYFWNNIFVDILWSAFINNFDLIKKGMAPVDFNSSSNSPAIDKVLDDINTGLQPKPIQ